MQHKSGLRRGFTKFIESAISSRCANNFIIPTAFLLFADLLINTNARNVTHVCVMTFIEYQGFSVANKKHLRKALNRNINTKL